MAWAMNTPALTMPKNAVTASNMAKSCSPAVGPNGMSRYTVKRISSTDQESELTDDLVQHPVPSELVGEEKKMAVAAGSFDSQVSWDAP
jgi:hypothetical protein